MNGKSPLVLMMMSVACLLGEAYELSGSWKIVLAENPSETEVYAAEEFRTYAEKISAFRLEIEKTGKVPDGNAVVIGSPETFPALRSAASRFKIESGRGDRLAVHTENGNLFLAGGSPRGALYAVYTFLTEVCGVRWLWPAPDGEFLPQKKKIEFPELRISQEGAFEYRGFHLCRSKMEHATETWMARNKLNIMRSSPVNGSSQLREWYDARRRKGFHIMYSDHNIALGKEMFEKHPELFALYQGKRVRHQHCWSNPEVDRLMIGKMVRACREYPVEILSIYPADNGYLCQCAKCRKLPPQDRWFALFRRIAEGVRAQCPGIKFATIAYQQYLKAPEGSLKDLNLEFMEYCMYKRCFVHKFGECRINREPLRDIAAWRKKGVPLGIYAYEFDIFNACYLHMPFYAMLQDQMRMFRKLKMRSVITETPSQYGTFRKGEKVRPYDHQRLAYYLYAALLWNPDADVKALMKDYCETAFSGAAAPMLEYFQLLAEAWERMGIHYSYYMNTPDSGSVKFLNEERIEHAERLLTQAEKAAGAIPDAKRRGEVARQIAVERNVFEAWHGIYRNFSAKAGLRRIVIPQAQAPGSLEGAVPLPPFKTAKKENAYPTEVLMNYDDNGLNLQVSCFDPAIRKLVRGKKNAPRDSALWNDECIEIFLSVPDSEKEYYHFAVNPSGTLYDAASYENSAKWNPRWKAVITIGKDRWTAGIRIPFEAFGKVPEPGDVWGFSIKRTRGVRNDFGNSGFPDAIYHDQHSFAEMEFSQRHESIPLLFFAKGPQKEIGWLKRRFDNAGYQMLAVSEEKELKMLTRKCPVIVIRTPGAAIPADFWSSYVLPLLREGALVLFTGYEKLPLDRYFQDPELALKWSGWEIDPARRTYDLRPGDWLTTPDNLAAVFQKGISPANGYLPERPGRWQSLASMKMKNGTLYSYLLVCRVGKGLLAVTSGDFGLAGGENAVFGSRQEQSLMLINNLREMNKNR